MKANVVGQRAPMFRQDVEGLRGIAVLSVVIYHANVSWLPGGFVGVDLFFVLSGYLIIGQLLKALESNQFSFADFYLRRVRRLAPAAVLTSVVVLMVGAWLALPSEFEAVAKAALFTGIFSSNLLFFKTSGYFDEVAEGNPLLHTWSLSVEEQFYLLAPLLLFLTWRYARRWLPLLLPLALVGSLLLAELAYSTSRSGAFYLTPFRAWELLAGACVHILPACRGWVFKRVLPVLALAVVVLSFWAVNEQSPIPGVVLTPFILSVVLLIWVGPVGGFAGVVLANPGLQWLGKTSYSLYLWHWPLFVYWGMYRVTPLNDLERLGLIIGSLIIGYLSWRFVEQPVRQVSIARNRKRFVVVGLGFVAFPVILGAIVIANSGFPQRFSADVSTVLKAKDDRDARRPVCFARQGKVLTPESACVYGADVVPSYILLGDSHANMYATALGGSLAEVKRSILNLSHVSCPPFERLQIDSDMAEACHTHNQRVARYLETRAAAETTLIVSLRGVAYADGMAWASEQQQWGSAGVVGRMKLDGQDVPSEQRRQAFATALTEQLERWLALGYRVVLFGSVPEFPHPVPETLARLVAYERDKSSLEISLTHYWQRNNWLHLELTQLNHANLYRIEPHLSLCDGVTCKPFKGAAVWYSDDDHLSQQGAKYVLSHSPVWQRVINER